MLVSSAKLDAALQRDGDSVDQSILQQMIDDEIEESLTLDYKASPALSKTDGKK